MKTIFWFFVIILCLVFMHLVAYLTLLFSGWVSGEIEFAKYVYELTIPAINLIWLLAVIIGGMIFIIEKVLTPKNKNLCQ